MNTKRAGVELPSQLLSNRLILGIIASYGLAFIVFGFLMSSPGEILNGLIEIITTRDALITDYIGVGGIGAAFVNAGLLTCLACLLYRITQASISGASIASLFLLLGFSLFGKNLLNVWPIIAGVWLYAKFRNESFAAYINIAFFGCALAPIFSEILYSTAISRSVSIPLALFTALLLGFILSPVATQLFKAHAGFNLYNIGFTAGVIGTLVVALYKSYGYVPDPVMIWTSENQGILTGFLVILFLSMLIVGIFLDRQSLGQLSTLVKLSGQAPSDFVAIVGLGATMVNMGLCGLLGLAYLLVIGADLNGPTIGGILTIVGFAAFGKHPLNIVPIMAGIFLGSLAKPWNINDPAIVLATLFGTTLAPISGQFGWQWGIVAGFLHSSAALTVGFNHAGLNLYNNGFAAGIVAAVMVPVIIAVKR
ncbi:MAG: DUF1576 domain-containing protein [Microcystis sp. M113S1]|jgi:hypothetical protein|uniref:DUF1576 domain-containing protein n=1 Tax=Microcystis aeruginosa G11-04 TaxID=2685956 RepID=A0A966G506_MICAE|nr:DUF1576 domain-containing protein [Microcystis sp. M113S1]NCR15304.1 DUF1576 domain-containing protein [Microcystis aeruginosa SX13-11]NCR19713.1 DUF1576 domain-containing protein [Microcystis aeruginosa LL13-03]NCR28971.1 DUF1576 domain-containing protein [Microcystis aeruginosa LE13-04]NCR46346.1 DUF1576 domain-containing protein [Microcystis aeruginosa SX13-01]NCR60292.1 DUF1576 domain-containing protein [Microcystis aeruginosa LL13-06]NCR69127.1 DUF1576 domain-containing protein [Micro